MDVTFLSMLCGSDILLVFGQQIEAQLNSPDITGVFLGEKHSQRSMRQAVCELLPRWKAQGVSTLSLEIRQQDVDDMIKSKDFSQWRSQHKAPVIKDDFEPESFYELVKAAHRIGLHVIGHEDPATMGYQDTVKKLLYEDVPDRTQKLLATLNKTKEPGQRTRLQEEFADWAQKRLDEIQRADPESERGMVSRNAFAENHISQHRKPGKIVVMGGAAHSQYYGGSRWPDSESTQKDGIDARLGLSTFNIDLYESHATTLGTVVSRGNRTFLVAFPHDLEPYLHKGADYSRLPAKEGPAKSSPHLPSPLPKPGNTR